MRKTQRKGDIAVAKAISTFTNLGYDVAIPLTESASYDLIVDTNTKNDKLKRIQIKYTGNDEVDLRNIHSNSKGYVVKKTKSGAYDWLYVLDSKGNEYLFKECLQGRRSIKTKNLNSLK